MDCSACKKEARVLGFLIVIPTTLGVFFAILMCFSTVSATSNMLLAVSSSAETAGVALSPTSDYWCALCVGLFSLFVGAAGWMFIMKKKLYKCVHCSSVQTSD